MLRVLLAHLKRGRVCTNCPSIVGSRICWLNTGASMVSPCSGLQKPEVSQSVKASSMPSSRTREKMLWLRHWRLTLSAGLHPAGAADGLTIGTRTLRTISSEVPTIVASRVRSAHSPLMPASTLWPLAFFQPDERPPGLSMQAVARSVHPCPGWCLCIQLQQHACLLHRSGARPAPPVPGAWQPQSLHQGQCDTSSLALALSTCLESMLACPAAANDDHLLGSRFTLLAGLQTGCMPSKPAGQGSAAQPAGRRPWQALSHAGLKGRPAVCPQRDLLLSRAAQTKTHSERFTGAQITSEQCPGKFRVSKHRDRGDLAPARDGGKPGGAGCGAPTDGSAARVRRQPQGAHAAG